MKLVLSILLASILVLPTLAANQTIQSFSQAKKKLHSQVYNNHRETVYCGAIFNAKKQVTSPVGFTTTKYIKRAKKIEWEHVVPAENFGRTFEEWRTGSKQCINSKGKAFKGRKCAERVNLEYRYMQADMYNLYPAIGAVNALRSNYNFTILPNATSNFGSCKMKIENRKAEPPESSRGRIARTYIYMEQTYKRYSMSKQQRRLMSAWDKTYPVNKWECSRANTIANIQGNENIVVKSRCLAKEI